MAIVIRTQQEIEKMRRSGIALRAVLDAVRSVVVAGSTTMDLERVAEAKIAETGGISAFKGYRGYPRTLCTSINSEVVHGIPSKKHTLREGDVVSIDCGVVIDGYYSDSAITVPVGKVAPEVEKLLQVTESSLASAIETVRPGVHMGDVGAAVQDMVEAAGFSVVREFVGHGIGTNMHEDPQVPNYGRRGIGIKLREGMVLAIEPMVNVGKPEVRVLEDGWTAVTVDGSVSAHFEHTVAVTADGAQVLTA
ncbi:MAG TPA: type I methionyl aminopeptidase [Acidobacteriaceae bacterium]|jgi:methionyl aminopeptidase|nr:type I methionyl aminopeptidase [Acidobacteriaceae bacterium]